MQKIHLTQGKIALVDDEDFEWLNKWKWYFHKTGYATTNGGKIFMHRLINNTPQGLHTDHINRKKLDNRRSNLRSVTPGQNSMNTELRKNNTSGYRGVTWHGIGKGYWRAILTVNDKPIHLGLFTSKIDAAKAYNNAVYKYFGGVLP